MAEILTEHKNAMAHILQEYESSYESILFVHAMMSAFYTDLSSTTHTRRAEIKTMTTEAGIQLRNITLAMHTDLANFVETRLNMYANIGKSLQNKINQLNQCIKDADHSLNNFHEIRQFIRTKISRVDGQLSRLSKIDYEVNKKLHIGNLKCQYNLHFTKLKDSFTDPYQDVEQVRLKADNYRKEHFSMMEYLEQNLRKEEETINKLIVQCGVVGQIMGSFQGIYQLLKLTLNKPQQPNLEIKQQIQQEHLRSCKNNWNDLISFNSKILKNSKNPTQRYSQHEPQQQQMLIR